MDITQFLYDLQNSGLANWVNTGGATYPVVESLHVLAVALVFGTILIVDVRLLGFASTNRPYTKVAHDLLHLTWVGFVVAVITGFLLFLPNATGIFANVNFQIKMLMIMLAGVNMFILELISARDVSVWDTNNPPPNKARIAGLLSLCFWTAVIVFGRLIGFTAVVDDPFAALL
ncbi:MULTISPECIES: DUF6644 family protein [unclassified Devosia]|uniref:DUF6644 family protein n=1 Tax=unclassified Devosia TaxID=196773 RepID=UPI0015F8395B|nr:MULTISPECIES: DUF6644 family protein [unclassified Devosia]MBJ6987839.1 hypothetical protein [Devosia sp. MC521]MBK1796162.1 hypothetical protein [Devosia sp. WQ 349K1]QMW63745.1 hypothetical protein H4N61_05315 [Devosia sp. MC521]